jgi:hypothetical protein
MVLFLCLISNRGARIGHQTSDHFVLVAYCQKNNFNFVYHPFTCNSSNFENVLQFGKIHTLHYDDIKNKVDKIVNIKDLNINNINNLHNKLIELHKSNEKILLFDSICGNENYTVSWNTNINDIIEIKKTYRNKLLKYYTKQVNTEYICIHIRCGDIVNDKSRYLDVQYFIDKYKELTNKIGLELPVYIITEQNFKHVDFLYKNIENCNIIQSDEITCFYYLVHCKYLIASRSGFSNLAYILGNMQVLIPPNDWNSYWDNIIE